MNTKIIKGEKRNIFLNKYYIQAKMATFVQREKERNKKIKK